MADGLAEPTRWVNTLEAVRKRPGMYVGSTDFFGLIHYLVCPFALFLGRGARQIDVSLTARGFEIRSDYRLPLQEQESGQIEPFECHPLEVGTFEYHGFVFNALSDSLVVRSNSQTLTYRRGERIKRTSHLPEIDGTRLVFRPDPSIFTVTNVSTTVLTSYLRRMSFLHAGVRFRLKLAGKTQEFFAPGGVRDLFDAIAAPYQILHEPIQVAGSAGRMQLELVFAYQSWTDHCFWSFINRGRAVEGGTHEAGLKRAFERISMQMALPKRKKISNGVVGVVSILYPEVIWEGCIKARIGNPELTDLVADLVTNLVTAWTEVHREVAAQIRQMSVFSFPEAWET